jgi:1,4-alpha-glucan branching enzyme
MSTKTLPKQKVTFSVLAPEAQSVKLVGDFSDWELNPVELRRLKDGEWKTTLSLVEGTHEYRYLVDGQWRDDPNCQTRVPNTFGGENCVRVVA